MALRDLGEREFHGSSYFLIFVVNDAGDLQRGKGIEAGGSNVLLLCPEITKFGFAGTHAVTTLVKGLNDCIVESGSNLFNGLRTTVRPGAVG